MQGQRPIRANALVVLAVVFYAPMLATAWFVRPPGAFRIEDAPAFAWGMGLAVAGAAAVIVGSRWASRRTRWGRALHRILAEAVGGLSSRHILWLSLLSAAGEEVLFRGVMHPRLGLWITAAIFAAFHFPVRRELVPWTLFAGGVGLGLGVLIDFSGTLWPAVLAHFLVNYLNLHDLVETPLPAEAPPEPPPPPNGAGP